MSEGGETPSAPMGERETAEGQEAEVPSKATMHTPVPEPVTVPPEPCLEPRPAVVGAFDSDTPKQQGIQKDGKKVTPEQAEEAKLRSKYGKLNKPGGSDFLRMRLNKGGQKYFDSGDYNVAMSKGKKLGLRQTPVATTKPGLPTPVEVTTGETIPTPASIHHRKQSTEISKLAV